MTENQAIEHWQHMMGHRLRKILQHDPRSINAVLAKMTLATRAAVLPGPLGTCTYTVGNMTVVMEGVTQAECEGKLGGTWVPDP